jgi:hypothetical protein
MKLQEHDYGFEAVLPDNRTPFKIKTSAKLFDILSSGIYKDKILAVIRELSCNAYDAHVVAKKQHVPFKIMLPTQIDPTFYVEDEGTGIDPSKIVDIYWTYGESSKTDSNDQIGALGLGSKSPFAYTKSSFVVKNRYQGKEYTYLCFINEYGMPDGSLVSEEMTDKLSGVTVEFAVRPEDISAFHERAARFFKRWSATMPIFVGRKVEEVITSKPVKIIEGTDWYLEMQEAGKYHDFSGAIAMQGNVPYPIEASSIPNLPKDLALIASNPFIITFDMGEVNFASSREALQYDERTCLNVIERLREVRSEIQKSFREKVFKPGMTHVEFIVNFERTYREFTRTIKVVGNPYHLDTDAWFLGLLLSELKTGTVTYDGASFVISDLLEKRITLEFDGYQSFGILKSARRNTRTKLFQTTRCSMLKLTAAEEFPTYKVFPEFPSTSVTHVGKTYDFPWEQRRVLKADQVVSPLDRAINSTFFKAKTLNTVNIIQKITFYVNDVGSSGEARYRELINNGDNGYFVYFNTKEVSVTQAMTELKALVETKLKGAQIVLLSTQPDLRPVIEKEKLESGSMKVRAFTAIFSKNQSKMKVLYNHTILVNEIQTTVRDDQVVKVADLQAQDQVIYVVKRRSPTQIFDSIEGTRESIISNNQLLEMAAKYAISDLLVPFEPVNLGKSYKGQSSLTVYILNEGQIEWLKRRKVKLIGYRQLVTDRIAALDKAEKFTEITERMIELESASMISSMYQAINNKRGTVSMADLEDQLADDSVKSMYRELYAEYADQKKNGSKFADFYAKLQLYQNFVSHDVKKNDLPEKLEKQYPMLGMLGNFEYLPLSDLRKIIKYIDLVDRTN